MTPGHPATARIACAHVREDFRVNQRLFLRLSGGLQATAEGASYVVLDAGCGGFTVIRPESIEDVNAGAYYAWLKGVLTSGDVEVFRAARAGVLVTSAWGHWGHNCHPSRGTLEAASGESARTLNRLFGVLIGVGWLHFKRRWNAPTIYCVAQVTDGSPRLPGPAAACPLCFADVLGATDLTPSVPSTGSEVSLYQEPLSGSAASGPPSESADERVFALTRMLIQH